MATLKNIASLIVLQNNQVLMRKTATGWQLPSYEDVSFYSHFHSWLRRVNDDLIGDFSIIHRVWQHVDEQAKTDQRWFYMENNVSGWMLPSSTTWVDVTALSTISHSNTVEAEHLYEMLNAIQQNPSNLRPIYMTLGWFATTRDWVVQSLEAHGYTLIHLPEQFKHTSVTSILRTETEQGAFYAKVENRYFPNFCQEASVLSALHEMFPEYLPKPLAVNPDSGMGIYHDFGVTLEDSRIDAETYRNIILAFASLQQSTSEHVDKLISLGCLDRRLHHLKTTFQQMITDGSLRTSLTDDLYHPLVSEQDNIFAYCDELASYNIPYCLVHGDFHEGNIALYAGNITFFDWTDACIAHPFFDICTLIGFKPPYRDDALFAMLKEAYLQSWSSYETPENLTRIYDVANIVNAVHQIISYQYIVQYSEPIYKPDFSWGVSEYVKLLLNQYDSLT